MNIDDCFVEQIKAFIKYYEHTKPESQILKRITILTERASYELFKERMDRKYGD